MSKLKIKSGFVAGFGNGCWFAAPPVFVKGIKVFSPRPWQSDCFASFQSTDKRHGIINAPTGSGKSTEMCHLSSDFLNGNHHRDIIAVPQKNIGSGFIGPIIFRSSNVDIEWRIEEQNNLCQKYIDDDSKTKKLINFLKDKAASRMVDRSLLCTHQTLMRVFDVLGSTNQLELMSNVSIWIDEAQKIQFDDFCSNKLGELIDYCCKNDIQQNIRLFLATATFFRGDRQNIIPASLLGKFHRFSLSYDRHFEENCEYLKSFRYDFILTDKGYLDAIKELMKNDVKKTIIWMPDVNSNLSNGDKIRDANEVVRAVANDPIANIDEDEDGVINLVHKSGKKIRGIDLVDDESDRDKKDQYIFEHPDKIDFIVNLRKFIEGADWPHANRGIIIGAKGSLRELIQMMGRLFRDHPSKKGIPVEIYHVFPHVSKKINKAKARDGINDLMKAIYCSLLLELILSPPKPKIPITKKGRFRGAKSSPIGIDYFAKMTEMSEIDLLMMIEDAIKDLTAYKDNHTNMTKDQLEIKYREIIETRIEKTPLKEYADDFGGMILLILERRTKEFSRIKIGANGVEVKNISANLIREDPFLGCFIGYTSDITSVKTLKDFRKLIDGLYEKWDKRFIDSVQFYKNNGRLPSQHSKNEEEAALGLWLDDQRVKNRGGKLCLEYKTKIEKSFPGFMWNVVEERLRNYVYLYKEFIANNGKTPSKHSSDKTEKKLGGWAGTIRTKCRDNLLSKEEIKFVESIEGWRWEVLDNQWMLQYGKAVQWIVSHNNEYPWQKSKDKEEASVGHWISHQREDYRNNRSRLTKFRKEKMEELPNWTWNPRIGRKH